MRTKNMRQNKEKKKNKYIKAKEGKRGSEGDGGRGGGMEKLSLLSKETHRGEKVRERLEVLSLGPIPFPQP
jgi:hypothetical protein